MNDITAANVKSIATAPVKSLVSSYLMARAFAEVKREKVSAVYAEILKEVPLYVDRTLADGSPIPGCTGERILSVDRMFLSRDKAACNGIYAEANKRLRALKIKPEDMSDERCPALVAEDLLRQIERELVTMAGEPLGISPDKLLCAGLDKYKEFVDLVVRLVVSLPDFKNPLPADPVFSS